MEFFQELRLIDFEHLGGMYPPARRLRGAGRAPPGTAPAVAFVGLLVRRTPGARQTALFVVADARAVSGMGLADGLEGLEVEAVDPVAGHEAAEQACKPSARSPPVSRRPATPRPSRGRSPACTRQRSGTRARRAPRILQTSAESGSQTLTWRDQAWLQRLLRRLLRAASPRPAASRCTGARAKIGFAGSAARPATLEVIP